MFTLSVCKYSLIQRPSKRSFKSCKSISVITVASKQIEFVIAVNGKMAEKAAGHRTVSLHDNIGIGY